LVEKGALLYFTTSCLNIVGAIWIPRAIKELHVPASKSKAFLIAKSGLAV
jgi:hypothetical protein